MSELENMTAPTDELQALLKKWDVLRKKVAAAEEEEKALRKTIAGLAFPKPKEGTNNLNLANGFVLEIDHKINRTVDRAALDTFKDTLESNEIDISALIREKPELRVGEYKKLSDKQRMIFDNCLTIKEGMPGMKIVMKKARGS